MLAGLEEIHQGELHSSHCLAKKYFSLKKNINFKTYLDIYNAAMLAKKYFSHKKNINFKTYLDIYNAAIYARQSKNSLGRISYALGNRRA